MTALVRYRTSAFDAACAALDECATIEELLCKFGDQSFDGFDLGIWEDALYVAHYNTRKRLIENQSVPTEIIAGAHTLPMQARAGGSDFRLGGPPAPKLLEHSSSSAALAPELQADNRRAHSEKDPRRSAAGNRG